MTALPAARPGFVPHGRPCLGGDEEAAALRVLRSGRLAPGAEAARCEALLARLSGGAAAVMLSSGTTALTLALRALRLEKRGRVAIPTWCCAAVLHAVRAANLEPLLCDIDGRTLALDPGDVTRRAGARRGSSRDRLAAVVLVHPFGQPAHPEPFRALGVPVIEDCCQALGAADRGRPAGARGDAAVFSFAPTKLVTCGGPGGGVSSPDARLVAAIRDLAGNDEKDDDRPRVNGLMGDLHAAIAATQLGRLGDLLAARRSIAARYDEAFAGIGLNRPTALPGSTPVVWRYLLRVDDAGAFIDRLSGRGIQARRPVYAPLHKMTGETGQFPASDDAQRRLASLPLHPAMTPGEIDRVIDEVRRCLR